MDSDEAFVDEFRAMRQRLDTEVRERIEAGDSTPVTNPAAEGSQSA
jgi:hypothetical protein